MEFEGCDWLLALILADDLSLRSTCQSVIDIQRDHTADEMDAAVSEQEVGTACVAARECVRVCDEGIVRRVRPASPFYSARKPCQRHSGRLNFEDV